MTERITSTVDSAPDIRKRTVPASGRGGGDTRIEPPPRRPSRRTEPSARIAETARAEPPPRSCRHIRQESVDRRTQPDQDSSDQAEVELDEHLVSLVAPTSFAAEEYRRLRLVLEQRRGAAGRRGDEW